MQDAEGEGAVGTGADDESAVCLFCRRRPIGVDGKDLRTLCLCCAHVMGEVDVGREHGEAPEDDEVAFLRFLRANGAGIPHDSCPAMTLGGGTDGAEEIAGAELVKERMVAVVMNTAHRAGVGIRLNGFGAVSLDDVLPLRCDFLHGIRPRNRLKSSFALPARAAKRRQKAAFGVNRALVMRHLWAERATRKMVLGVPGDADGAAVFNFDEKAAAVGAVEWTDRAVDFFLHGGSFLLEYGIIFRRMSPAWQIDSILRSDE